MPESEVRKTTRAVLGLLAMVCVACGGDAREHANASHTDTVAATSTVTLYDSATYPAGPEGVAARRGFAILAATRDSLPDYVDNSLRCLSCHIDDGRRPNGIPLRGTYARYPN